MLEERQFDQKNPVGRTYEFALNDLVAIGDRNGRQFQRTREKVDFLGVEIGNENGVSPFVCDHRAESHHGERRRLIENGQLKVDAVGFGEISHVGLQTRFVDGHVELAKVDYPKEPSRRWLNELATSQLQQ